MAVRLSGGFIAALGLAAVAGQTSAHEVDLSSREAVRLAFEHALQCGPTFDGREAPVARALRKQGVKIRTSRSFEQDYPLVAEYRFDPPLQILGARVDRVREEGDSGGVLAAFARADLKAFAEQFKDVKPMPAGGPKNGFDAMGWGYGGAYFKHSQPPTTDTPFPNDFFIGRGKAPGRIQFGCQYYDN